MSITYSTYPQITEDSAIVTAQLAGQSLCNSKIVTNMETTSWYEKAKKFCKLSTIATPL